MENKSDQPTTADPKCECGHPQSHHGNSSRMEFNGAPCESYRPPATTEPAGSEGKRRCIGCGKKLRVSECDPCERCLPTAPPAESAGVEAWGMLAEFEMSGNHWRDRDTVRFAIEYAAKQIEIFIEDVYTATGNVNEIYQAMQKVKEKRK